MTSIDRADPASSIPVPPGKEGRSWEEIYEVHRLAFPDAYLVASAERSGVGVVASFDRSIDRVGTVKRDEPR